ncbi:MAG: diguanylate cyclase [Deltaproteobacteria bacterium]|nr:diguanylate cyclase [Deltaproteobacteria bacterium]
MILVLLTSLALQLSVFLLFRKLGQRMQRPGIWTVVALALMAVPCSGTVYQLIQSHRTMVPLSDLVPLVGTFLATFVSLGILPVAYLMIHSREGQGGEVRKINASLQEEIAQRKRAEEQLRALSFTDELTGLFNRRGILTMGAHQLKISRRARRRLLLIYADLDNMKKINDKFGHMEGDAALVEAADVLREVFRESDIIGRIGGDEFVILAVDSDGVPPEALINRIHQRCILANLRRAHPYVLAMSTGSAEFNPDHAVDLEELISQADRAMYTEKQARQKRPVKKEIRQQAELDLAFGSSKIAS